MEPVFGGSHAYKAAKRGGPPQRQKGGFGRYAQKDYQPSIETNAYRACKARRKDGEARQT
jgi:hypothetical protein